MGHDIVMDAILALVILFPAGFVFSDQPQQLPPILQSRFFAPHVLAYMLSYVLMAKAAVYAAMGCFISNKKSEAQNSKLETNSNNQNPNAQNVLNSENSNLDIVSDFEFRIYQVRVTLLVMNPLPIFWLVWAFPDGFGPDAWQRLGRIRMGRLVELGPEGIMVAGLRADVCLLFPLAQLFRPKIPSHQLFPNYPRLCFHPYYPAVG